jgi:sulfonate transport system substrate-binding protein
MQTLQEIKGKRIAFQKASSAHNFVIQIVERAGLTYKDIQPVYLSPPDAHAAFDSGSIDAWAIWDPFLTIAQQKTGGRILVNSKGIQSAGGFYLSSPTFARKHPDWIKIVLQEIADSNAWAYDHPVEAGALRQKASGIDAALWQLIQRHAERTGIVPITESVIQAQQLTAENYYKIGLLPQRLNIRECVLTPAQYAQFVPAGPPLAQTAKTEH